MPAEMRELERRLWHDEREIRRLRVWLQEIAMAQGVRATAIIGVIPDGNLPATSLGGTLVYVGFGDDPSSTGGIDHSGGTATGHTMDLIVQT